MAHLPVLLEEVLTDLDPQPDDVMVDATINRGGHAGAICQQLSGGGFLVGIDADGGALVEAKTALAQCPCPVRLIESNFRHLAERLQEVGIASVNGILMDLGWSSDELERSGRGFSFRRHEPLLMTYASNPGPDELTAARIVNQWSEERLVSILREFGEERFAPRIAAAIVATRRLRPIETTDDLVTIVLSAVPAWYTHRRLHPATKTFQAIRMATNDELGALQAGLVSAWQVLAPGGRLAVISFHSLEARIVKTFFQGLVREGRAEFVHKKVTKPTYAQTRENPRSRSAQLRTIKRVSL